MEREIGFACLVRRTKLPGSWCSGQRANDVILRNYFFGRRLFTRPHLIVSRLGHFVGSIFDFDLASEDEVAGVTHHGVGRAQPRGDRFVGAHQ